MLQPLQLEEVSIRYAREIAELQDFLAKSGLPLNAPEAMSALAAKLREDRAFRRDLKSHVWVAVHASSQQISYSDLLGMLAIAAAGTRFAAAAGDDDTHDLLRFLIQARSAFETIPQTQEITPARPFAESRQATLLSFAEPQDDHDRSRLVWIGAAACMLLVLLLGLWFHRQSAADRGSLATSAKGPAANMPASVSAGRDNGSSAQQESETTAAVRNPRRTPYAAKQRRPRRGSQTVAPRQTPLRASVSPATESGSAVPPVTPVDGLFGSRSASAPASTIAKAPAAESPNSSRLLRRSPLATADSPGKKKSNLVAKSDATDDSGADKPAAGASHEGIVRSTSLGIMAANVTYSPAPAYPAAASSLHVQGEVRLEAEVDRDGNVVSTRIISGPSLLQEAAVDAVQRWHYRPYLYDGKPIGMNATVVVDFQLPSM